MGETSLHLIVAAFDTEAGAEKALQTLRESRDAKLIGIQAAVVLHKDEEGQIHFKDVGLTPAKGAVSGVVLGAVVGVLTGGTGIALGAIGALVGSLVGRKKRDSRFPTERLNKVAASLAPDSSAIVLVMEPGWVVVVEEELGLLGAEVLSVTISPQVADQLQAHAALESESSAKADNESASKE